jgi:hypothetical protein
MFYLYENNERGSIVPNLFSAAMYLVVGDLMLMGLLTKEVSANRQ